VSPRGARVEGIVLPLLAALALTGGAARAATEAEERVAALLAVMQADTARPASPGIRARLLESASLLPLMLREASAPPEEVVLARRLYPTLRQGDPTHIAAFLAPLVARHPYTPPAISGDPRLALAQGAAIHRHACAGCHDHPQPRALLPAEDLYRLACRETETAFAARLFLGVKGQRDTGYRNPFSPAERAALAFWYRRAKPCAD
jgi:hypothetical protein